MADTGWINPASADQTGGGEAFDTPSNVFTSNNSYAFKDVANLSDTTTLRAYNFSAGIPTSATIDGVQVRAEVRSEDGDLDWLTVRLLSITRSPTGNNRSTGNSIGTSDTYVTFGNSTDKWGLNLTPAWINDTDFGFGTEFFNSDTFSNRQMRVDHMQIKVYYTPVVVDIVAMIMRIG